MIQNPHEAGDLASEVKDTGGVYFVTGFSGLFAPYWDQTATGMLIGLSAYTTRHHICRATLEAICFQTRAILEAMSKDAGFTVATTTTATNSPILPSIFTFSSISSPVETVTEHIAEDKLLAQLERNLKRSRSRGKAPHTPHHDAKDVLKVDGGMTASDVFLQMQADVLGIPVERPTMRESVSLLSCYTMRVILMKMSRSTALGAALLAGAAMGLFDWDISKPKTLLNVNKAGVRLFEPSLKEEEKNWKYAGWNRAIERAVRNLVALCTVSYD